MSMIELDSQTTQQLEFLAAKEHLSAADYLRHIVKECYQMQSEDGSTALQEMALALTRSLADMRAGRMIQSTGDYYADKKRFETNEPQQWQ